MTLSLPSSEKRFCPTYLVCRKVSNASAALSRTRMCFCSSAVGLVVALLDPFLDPAPLLRVLDVHVLDADPAAVRVAQHAEDVAQLHPLLTGEAADRERSGPGPTGSARAGGRPGPGACGCGTPAGRCRPSGGRGPGTRGSARCTRAALSIWPSEVCATSRIHRTGSYGMRSDVEDLVVEAVLAEQQLMHDLEELAGLGALDDPVVVGAGQRDDLADGEVGQGGRRSCPGERRGVLHRADADDGALTLHEPRASSAPCRCRPGWSARSWCRRSPPWSARCAGPGGPRPRTPARTVGSPCPGVPLMAGHHQVAAAVRLGQVDGDAEVDVLRDDQRRLAVDLGEGVVHLRVRGQRPDHRVANEVGEADLAAAAPGEVVVDHDAVVRRAASPAPRGRWSRWAPASEASMFWHDLGGHAAERGGAGAGRRRRCLGGRLRGRGRRAAGAALVGTADTGSAAFAPGRPSPARPSPGRPRWVRRPALALLRGLGPGLRRLGRSPARGAGGARRRPVVGEEVVPGRVNARRVGRGTAGTCPRRSTHWGRNPPVGCPASSSLGWTRQRSPLSTRWRSHKTVLRFAIQDRIRLRLLVRPFRLLVARFTHNPWAVWARLWVGKSGAPSR